MRQIFSRFLNKNLTSKFHFAIFWLYFTKVFVFLKKKAYEKDINCELINRKLISLM